MCIRDSDALDETAATPQQKAAGTLPAVDRILAPLISAAQRTRLRLVLGTRKHLLPALGTPLDGSAERTAAPVPYTHLTLPTSDLG